MYLYVSLFICPDQSQIRRIHDHAVQHQKEVAARVSKRRSQSWKVKMLDDTKNSGRGERQQQGQALACAIHEDDGILMQVFVKSGRQEVASGKNTIPNLVRMKW